MTGWFFALGRVLGLSTAGGVRPALTLTIIAAMDKLDVGHQVTWPFRFIDGWGFIIALGAVAIFESKFDTVEVLRRLQDRLLLPWRIVGGSIAGAATVGHGTTGLVIGLVLGAFGAWLGQAVQHGAHPLRPQSGLLLALLSLSEEVFAFAGTITTGIYSGLGYVFFGVNVWLLALVRRRRRLKYKAILEQARSGEWRDERGRND